MKKITIVWVICIVFLTILLTIIGIYVTNKTKPYKALEADIVEAMKVYYGQDSNLKKLPDKDRISKITIKELEDFGLKINSKINDDNCEGYGIVRGLSVSYSYNAFIKCTNYETEEYEKNK